MPIEVLYAMPERQERVVVDLHAGATAIEAIRASGLLERHPEIGLRQLRIGIYGKVVAPEVPLAEGDRVEIYRPLAADPKSARRQRAQRKR